MITKGMAMCKGIFFTWLLLFSAFSLCSPNGFSGEDSKSELLDNVIAEENGGVSLKVIPDTLSIDDKAFYFGRMAEWMLRYYKKPIDEALLKDISSLCSGMNSSSYKRAYEIFSGKSKKLSIMLTDVYTLNANRYECLIKDYNKQAKTDGMPQVDFRRGVTCWRGGIRMELCDADMETLKKAMKSGNLRAKLKPYVKREIDAGRPLVWAKINGIGAKEREYYGVRLCVIVGYDLEKGELSYIRLEKDISERSVVGFDEVAATTWAFYKVISK